jgi:PKD repeat protein
MPNAYFRTQRVVGSGIPAPVADFTGTPTSGTVPFSVTFTDSSTGSITSWSWTFGDGGTSTSQNPTHSYTTSGTYSVVLTVTGPGGSNSLTRTSYVTASDPIVIPDANTALIGDSLTTEKLGYNWSPFFWINGIGALGAQKVIHNAGVSGDTISQMLSRVNNMYNDPSPGLDGLGTLGIVYFRGGTNDARASTALSGLTSTYTSLLNAIKTYCTKVIILSVPPIGPSESSYASKNLLTQDYNAWLAAFAAANPTGFTFVDDSANLRDGSGAQLSGYFNSDGIHNDGRATWKEGVDGSADLASLFSGYSYVSPLSTDPADVYPAEPQWNDNHTMSGTGGTGFSGTIATGYGVSGYGSGFAGTCSIVAADVSDPNQVPWQRVTPTQVGYTGSGEALLITKALTGRTVTTVDPAVLDIMVEIRFIAFDTNYFKWSRIMVMGNTSSQPIMPDLDLKMGGEIITQDSVVARIAMPRILANTESGLSIRWEFATRSAFTGSMGSFDFRCLTVRG